MRKPTSDLAQLRRDCDLSWTIWVRQTGGMQVMILREKGLEALIRFKLVILGQHQEGHYMDGLKKLGIHNDPPAVAAAKYHYLSNIIGGCTLEYAEESPKKAWIRYTYPNPWFHGSALLAVPASVQRTVFAAWHAKNAEKMGCPRLGYVCTKVWQDGEPYDEGYFIEYDRNIGPNEAVRYDSVTKTPEFDPAKAPQLDPKEWPEERVLRAKRKYAGAFVRTTAKALWNVYGLSQTCYMIQQSLALLAVQNLGEMRERMGHTGNGFEGVVGFLDHMLRAREDDYTVETLGANRRAISLRSYKPLEDDAIEDLRQAFFAFPSMCVRLMNGRVRMTRRMELNKGARDLEVWELEDTGHWLY